MSTKAKFYVQSAEHSTGADPDHMQGSVKLGAVCRGKINAKWASATPSGQLQMYITNPPAFRWFHDRIGKEVAITIEDANHDPATHAFVAVPDEFQPTEDQLKHGYRREETCLECGYAEGAHS